MNRLSPKRLDCDGATGIVNLRIRDHPIRSTAIPRPGSTPLKTRKEARSNTGQQTNKKGTTPKTKRSPLEKRTHMHQLSQYNSVASHIAPLPASHVPALLLALSNRGLVRFPNPAATSTAVGLPWPFSRTRTYCPGPGLSGPSNDLGGLAAIEKDGPWRLCSGET